MFVNKEVGNGNGKDYCYINLTNIATVGSVFSISTVVKNEFFMLEKCGRSVFNVLHLK
jgi:hypothetical protein